MSAVVRSGSRDLWDHAAANGRAADGRSSLPSLHGSGERDTAKADLATPETMERREITMRHPTTMALALAVAALLMSACDTAGSRFDGRQEFTTSFTYVEPATGERSTITFDQVVEDGVGTAQVRITNLNGYCIWPNWQARLVIGMVDRTVGGIPDAPILPSQSAVVETFSFRPRVDLASISFAMTHVYLYPFGTEACP